MSSLGAFLHPFWLQQWLQEAQPHLGRVSVNEEVIQTPVGTRTCQREEGAHGAGSSEVRVGLVTSMGEEGK